MPNHFHLMVLVKSVENQSFTSSESFTIKANDQALTNRTFNDSIGILLRTYTRAINKQNGVTGSLFRKETKAECINCFNGNKPIFIRNSALINNHLSEKQYPQIWFNYIHQNPVKAKLVKNEVDWEFSSAMDYKGLRNGKLINKEVTNKYVNF